MLSYGSLFYTFFVFPMIIDLTLETEDSVLECKQTVVLASQGSEDIVEARSSIAVDYDNDLTIHSKDAVLECKQDAVLESEQTVDVASQECEDIVEARFGQSIAVDDDTPMPYIDLCSSDSDSISDFSTLSDINDEDYFSPIEELMENMEEGDLKKTRSRATLNIPSHPRTSYACTLFVQFVKAVRHNKVSSLSKKEIAFARLMEFSKVNDLIHCTSEEKITIMHQIVNCVVQEKLLNFIEIVGKNENPYYFGSVHNQINTLSGLQHIFPLAKRLIDTQLNLSLQEIHRLSSEIEYKRSCLQKALYELKKEERISNFDPEKQDNMEYPSYENIETCVKMEAFPKFKSLAKTGKRRILTKKEYYEALSIVAGCLTFYNPACRPGALINCSYKAMHDKLKSSKREHFGPIVLHSADHKNSNHRPDLGIAINGFCCKMLYHWNIFCRRGKLLNSPFFTTYDGKSVSWSQLTSSFSKRYFGKHLTSTSARKAMEIRAFEIQDIKGEHVFDANIIRQGNDHSSKVGQRYYQRNVQERRAKNTLQQFNQLVEFHKVESSKKRKFSL